METEKYKTVFDFMRALEGTPLIEIFRIMEEGTFNDIGLPEKKEAEFFVSEMTSFQKAAQTLLSRLEKEYKELEKTALNITVPKRNSADFETFVHKLERLEKLQDDILYAWDFLWADIEKCTKKSRENMIICADFKIALQKNNGQEALSLNGRFEKAMIGLGFRPVPIEDAVTIEKRRKKMN